jgi:phosphate:Na+ symporter
MTGIVIVMVSNGVMGMNNGLFITLGANVGTCVTALIGIIGGNINAKRTAVIHLTFNIFGCLLFTPILWIFNKPILNILGKIVSKEAMQIAYFHLFFNCTTALITTPLIDYLEKIAKYVVKDEKKEEEVIKGLINDVNNIDINPRETTNSLNEEEKDKKQDNEEKKYEPPLNMINEDLKDNNNENYREKKEDITKDKREEKDHEKDFENIKVNKEKEKEKEEKIEEKNDNEEDEKEEIKDKNDNEKKGEKNGEEKANEKKEDDDIIEVKKDE